MYDDEPTIMGQALPKAMLVVRQGTQAGMSYPLSTRQITLGRDEGVDIILQDPESSRKHSRITLHNGEFTLEDMGSTNGTFINGIQLTAPQVLKPGDSIGIGQTTLVFQMAGSAVSATPIPQQSPVYPGPTMPMRTQNENQTLRYALYGFGCLILLCICIVATIIAWVVVDPTLFESITGFRLTMQVVPYLATLLA